MVVNSLGAHNDFKHEKRHKHPVYTHKIKIP